MTFLVVRLLTVAFRPMIARSMVARPVMMLVKLPRSIRTVELVALARNTQQTERHGQQQKFHHGFS